MGNASGESKAGSCNVGAWAIEVTFAPATTLVHEDFVVTTTTTFQTGTGSAPVNQNGTPQVQFDVSAGPFGRSALVFWIV